LPIAAVQAGLCKKAIACDIRPGPLEIAVKNINNAKLAKKIETRLGDGLLPLEPGEAESIVISGMGGMRIWGILQEGMLQARQAGRLILQPQHDVPLLRKNLHLAGFKIFDERLIYEEVAGRGHFYVLLAASYVGEVPCWSEQEYFLGKHIMTKGGEILHAFKEHETSKILKYIDKIADEDAKKAAIQQIEWLKPIT